MLFKERHIPLIRSGTKTATRRDWGEGYNRPTKGSVHMAQTEFFESDAECDCYIRICEVYQEPLGEMDHADAEKEGGYTLEDFRRAWEVINGEGSFDPEQVVDVVEFEYVGQERPEEAESDG